MSIVLRPYQVDIINKTRALMLQGKRSILIQSPTGSGKTALSAAMLKSSAAKGMACWFVVHRRELIKQSVRAFHNVDIRAGIVAGGFPGNVRLPIQICSIQALVRKFQTLRKPKLIVWDESHHVGAASWSRIKEAFPDAFHIGLSATPQRLDGKGLGKWFEEIIHGPSVAWLIEKGFLSPYKLYAPSSTINTDDISIRMGDFLQKDLAIAADKPTITGDAIHHYRKYADGKRAIAFCVSIEHSKHVAQQFLNAGIPAAHVDGETEVAERDRILAEFEAGKIRVLSNVELFGEGFDVPALECAILLRPTQSLGLYLQQVGRTLRVFPGKATAIILDHAGNCQRHGLPDEARDWTLEGITRGAKKKTEGAPVKICPKCFAAQFSGSAECRFCGFVFAVESRVVEEVKGELREVDVEEIRRIRNREQSKAASLDDLIALGKERGYKRPYHWAKHVFNARQARRNAGL